MDCTACQCQNCKYIPDLVQKMHDKMEKLEKKVKRQSSGSSSIVLGGSSKKNDMEDMEAWHITHGYRDRLGLKSGEDVMYMRAGSTADRETLERIKNHLKNKLNADMISINNVVVHYSDGKPPEVKFNANEANNVKRSGKQYTKDDLRDTFNFEKMKTVSSAQMLEYSNKTMPSLGWEAPAPRKTASNMLLEDVTHEMYGN
jgi:hypothetical protein